MSKAKSTVSIPKSMRHKRILDAAEENPDASLEALADTVPSATPDLVENVLEEYGDPADTDSTNDLTDTTPETTPTTETTPTDTHEYLDLNALTAVQRETLHAIHENPAATQRELGDRLGVSPATISNRVNAIPNFEWAERTTIAATILDTATDDDTPMPSTNGTGTQAETGRHEHSTTSADQPTTDKEESAFADPEFAYKILRACINAEDISEDEERRLFIELHK